MVATSIQTLACAPHGKAVVLADRITASSQGGLMESMDAVGGKDDGESTNPANSTWAGTTIVQISPGGSVSLFAHIDASALPGSCPGHTKIEKAARGRPLSLSHPFR